MVLTTWIDRGLTAAVLIAGVLVACSALAQSPGNFSTLSTTGTATLNGDTLMCSGRPWIDVRCPGMSGGAVGDDSHDDTAAIQATINAAIAGNWPVHIPAGKYKVTSLLAADYASQASKGFRLISDGAVLDGTTISSGPVLQILCSGGTPSSPTGCFYLKVEGTLDILANSGQQTLATLTAGYSTGATVLGVSTTTPFTVGGTVIINLHGGGTFAAPVDAISPGVSITLHTGLPSSADANANVSRPSYPFMLGTYNFADAHNSVKLDHLLVNNSNSSAGAGGCQFNYVLDSDLYAVCDSAGGAAGIALEQTQFSRISGAGTAAATGGASLVLENGYNFSNTFLGLDLEVSPICLSISDMHDGQNTFLSPYFNCTTAVSATASTRNLLINPNFGGAVVNRGPQSTGIEIVGTGNRVPWQFPAVASYTASGIDDKTTLSSYNAPGAALSVTLPSPAGLETGWSMGFTTDNGKGLNLVTSGSASILAGGKSFSSLALAAGNGEYARLQFDGSNFRAVGLTRNTRMANGISISRDFPGNWLFPSTSGYQAALADNGNVLSSFNTGSGLTVTLPLVAALSPGWSMGFATDNDKSLTINTATGAGGHILWPGSGASATTLSLANTSQGAYEFLVLQYDGSGNFRVVEATPATAQSIGIIGSAGISHWSFPAVSAYAATAADNGNVIDSANSPLSSMAVTLPPTTAISMGWTIAIASDGGKAQAVQVNGSAGGHILFPGSGATTNSVSLASGSYEYLALSFDGANFRVTAVTPATAAAMGMTGAAFALNRWNFPSAGAYAAGPSDSGNVLSSYNTASGLTVTLPSTTAIQAGWIMGFASDNGMPLSVQVNATSGGHILEPARGGTSVTSIALASGQNYEFLALQFDGSNFRIVEVTPQSLNLLGGLITPGTPASSSAACSTGALQFDANYLYACTATNTWKRSAWSSF
ncbi:MAG TPA: glycosyl hydrolase family 28-related protein [Stellaceae bacterium]|nr:glycosyl hydrolase family 28-related protein [Stellaceae bacterium]